MPRSPVRMPLQRLLAATILLSTWAGTRPGDSCGPAPPPPGPGTDWHGDPLPEGALARLGTLRFRQWTEAYSVASSPDGRLIAVGGSCLAPGPTLALFDASTGKVVRRLPGHAHVVRAVAFSPDGKLLASGGGDGQLAVWDVARGEQLHRVEGLGSDAIAFLADGKTLAADAAGAAIRLLDATTGKPGLLLKGHTDRVFSIAASRDGKHLASCAMDGTVRVWDPSAGKEVRRFRVADKYGLAVAFSPDGKVLACGTFNGTVYLWDVAAGRECWRAASGASAAASVAFSPDGAELYTIREELRALDTATGKPRRAFRMPVAMRHLALFPDGKVAALISNGAEVMLVDPVRGGLLGRREGHARGVCSVAFAPDGGSVATASGERAFRLWDAATGRPRRVFHGDDAVASVAFAPEGRALATAGPWERGGVWDPATGERVRQFAFESRTRGGGRVAYPAGRPGLVAADLGGSLVFWDAATGKRHPHSFSARPDFRSSGFGQAMPFALAPDGKTAAVLPDLGERKILFWDFRTGKEILATAVRGSPCAFSPDGGLLAARSDEGVVFVEVRSGREAGRLQGLAGPVRDVAFSPDGNMLATAGEDGAVRLWETASRRERRHFAGHEQAVACVAFSPDGGRLASGSDDLTALVWDVYGGRAKGPAGALMADALWAALADADADRAFAVLCHLRASPERAVALARARLRRVAPTNEKRIEALLADLDGERFAVREKARVGLEKVGPVALPLLEKAAAEGGKSLEFRRRLEQILARLGSWRQSAEGLRVLRLVEALGHGGSPAARQVLTDLAAGAEGAPQTAAARRALRRSP